MAVQAANPGSGKVEAARGEAAGRDRAIALIARYPDVSSAEAREILTYVKRARYRGIERLRTDASAKLQLDRFMRGNRQALRLSGSEIVAGIALVIAFLAICWLLWHAAVVG